MPPIGVITAAVPQAPASLNSSMLSIKQSLSSTSIPRYSLAMCSREYLVILGRIDGDIGVTNLSSLVIPKKLAAPTSSILV